METPGQQRRVRNGPEKRFINGASAQEGEWKKGRGEERQQEEQQQEQQGVCRRGMRGRSKGRQHRRGRAARALAEQGDAESGHLQAGRVGNGWVRNGREAGGVGDGLHEHVVAYSCSWGLSVRIAAVGHDVTCRPSKRLTGCQGQ